MRQRQLQGLIYHCGDCEPHRDLPSRCFLRCAATTVDASLYTRRVPAATSRRQLKEPLQYSMSKPPRYTSEHAAAGLDAEFPEIETWPNQFPGYEIIIDDPEFTSVCPKTGLPDFGVITLRYQPNKVCLELKSYKEYLHTYRNLGIFQENVVNRVLEDVVRWAKPVWAEVKGDFRPRGGISTTVVARWPRANRRSK
jgi:7-cyano-7-deazaguanine reductase